MKKAKKALERSAGQWQLRELEEEKLMTQNRLERLSGESEKRRHRWIDVVAQKPQAEAANDGEGDILAVKVADAIRQHGKVYSQCSKVWQPRTKSEGAGHRR